ncbi:hypothetical protein T07_15228 [Trichinella nelsoni]|uniref:Uncharacterized protein n=1 Tax=Trichinella nelsoni TaxID=6336 RepID=A0A0V0RB37_9BILA|nr:hypothetical protein T07_15228 [Trichinella nelsoni]
MLTADCTRQQVPVVKKPGRNSCAGDSLIVLE